MELRKIELEYKKDLIAGFKEFNSEFDSSSLEKFDFTPATILRLANAYSKEFNYYILNESFNNNWLDSEIEDIIKKLGIISFFENLDVYVFTDRILLKKRIPLININSLREYINAIYPFEFNEDFFQESDIIIFSYNFKRFFVIHHEGYFGSVKIE